MAEPDKPIPKPLVWMGSSLKDLKGFPDEVTRAFGYGLYLAQIGDTHADAKMMKGFDGGSVLELVEDFDGSTYRGVYTVRFKEWIYVLHAFQKKSKRGRKTPQADIETVRRRLKDARADYEKRKESRK